MGRYDYTFSVDMEAYIGYAFLLVLGLVLALLIRSITKMYERLWNSANGKKDNPQETYETMLEALNSANKLAEDRARKRIIKTREPNAEEQEEALSVNPQPDDLQRKVDELYETYKRLEEQSP